MKGIAMGYLIYNKFDGTLTTVAESIIFTTETLSEEDALLMASYLEEENTDALDEVAKRNGKNLEEMLERIGYGDLSYTNSITYSPRSLREEADIIIQAGTYEDYEDAAKVAEMLNWVLNAPDDSLNLVAQYILADDRLFSEYKSNFIAGLKWFYESQKI